MKGVGGVGGTRGSSGKAGSGVTVAVGALVEIGVGAPVGEVAAVAVSELTSLAKRGIFAGDAVGVGRSDFVVSFLQRSFSFSLSFSLSLSRLDFSLSLLDDFLSCEAAALVNLYLCSNTILRISILESSLLGFFLGVLLLLLLLELVLLLLVC